MKILKISSFMVLCATFVSGCNGGGHVAGVGSNTNNVMKTSKLNNANYSSPIYSGYLDFQVPTGALDNVFIQAQEVIPQFGNDGTIYVLGLDSSLSDQYYVYAFNQGETSKKWRAEVTGQLIGLKYSSSDNTIYALSNKEGGGNKIFAFDENGNLKWTYLISGDFYYSSFTVDKSGLIYVEVPGTGLFILNNDGQKIRSIEIGNSSNVVVDEDSNYYIISSDIVYSYRKDGVVNWSKPLNNSRGLIIGQDGNLYLTADIGGNSVIYKTSMETGEYQKVFMFGGLIMSNVEIDKNGNVYGVENKRGLVVYSSTGRVAWTHSLTSGGSKSFRSIKVGSNSDIYVREKNSIYTFNVSGINKWEYHFELTSHAGIAESKNVAYINSNGILYGINSPQVVTLTRTPVSGTFAAGTTDWNGTYQKADEICNNRELSYKNELKFGLYKFKALLSNRPNVVYNKVRYITGSAAPAIINDGGASIDGNELIFNSNQQNTITGGDVNKIAWWGTDDHRWDCNRWSENSGGWVGANMDPGKLGIVSVDRQWCDNNNYLVCVSTNEVK